MTGSTSDKSDGWLLPWVLTAIEGALIAFVIANYETLIPYHWESFTTPDGRLSLEFPGKAVADDQQRTLSGGGTVTVHMVGTQTADRKYYSFARDNLQDSLDRSADDRLDSARDGAIKNVQGHLLSEKRITVQTFPAREIQAHIRGEMFLDARLIAVEDQLLMLMVMSPSENSRDAKNIQNFYDSFKIHPLMAPNVGH
jgi:hypothetical protein